MRDVYSSLRWMAVARAITQALSWVSTLLVMRLLSVDDYGLVAMATLFSGYLLFLSDLGLTPALISRREKDPNVLRAATGLSLVVGVALFVLMAITAPLISSYFRNDDLTPLVQVAALQFLVVGISTVPYAVLAIEMKFREISIAGMTSAFATTLVTLWLAWASYGAWSLIIGNVAGGVVKAVHMLVYAGGPMRPSAKLSQLRGVIRSSSLLLMDRSAFYWLMQIDSLIVGRRLGQATLGVLTVGKELALIPVSKLMEIVLPVGVAALSRLNADKVEYGIAYMKSLRMAMLIGFPALWGIALVAGDLVPLAIGEQWRPAALVVQIVAAVLPLRLAAAFSQMALQGLDRPALMLRNTASTLALAAALVLFGSQWGLLGVTIAWAIAIPFSFIVSLRSLCSCLPLSPRDVIVNVAQTAFPAIVMTLAVLAAQSLSTDWTAASRISLCIPVGALVWATTVRIFQPNLWIQGTENVRRMLGRSA
jgi:O-antigen/teichoic acid export membrane protein